MEQVFWICAGFGSAFFLLKVILMVFAGLDHDMDSDVHHDIDSAEGTEESFKVLSITSITGFLMMFGWVGLACLKEYQLGAFSSILGASVAGVAFAYAIAYLFSLARKFKDSGDDFSMEETVGKTAKVYQEIKESGSGKIQLSLRGMTRELNAVSEGGEAIASFVNVEITKVIDEHTVSVKPKE